MGSEKKHYIKQYLDISFHHSLLWMFSNHTIQMARLQVCSNIKASYISKALMNRLLMYIRINICYSSLHIISLVKPINVNYNIWLANIWLYTQYHRLEQKHLVKNVYHSYRTIHFNQHRDFK